MALVLWKAVVWKINSSWKGKHMEKPFDLKDLANRIKVKSSDVKGKALDFAEDEAKLVVEETLAWIQDSVIATENKVDDLAVPVLMVIKPVIMKQVDKIDGKEG